MFYAICFCLLFGVLFLVLSLGLMASLPAFRLVRAMEGRTHAGATANLLFALRMLPFLLGGMVSVGLALPAFLEFEPSSTHEIPGAPLFVLAALGVTTLAIIAWRCARILHTTMRLQRQWLRTAVPLSFKVNGVPVFRVEESRSLLAVAGILRPRIFVSRDVADTLTASELNAALSHELAHVNASDNLKQFWLKVTRLPRWVPLLRQIDSLWNSTSEIAADEHAITHGASPLELSSALVKVGRLSSHGRQPRLLTASHLVDGCTSATMARATRLREWLEHGTAPSKTTGHDSNRHIWFFCTGTLLLLYIAMLGTVLPQLHEVLEFLVR